MSTHHHVKASLEKALAAHRRSHAHHLEQAGLGDYVDTTMSPLGTDGQQLTVEPGPSLTPNVTGAETDNAMLPLSAEDVL